MAAANKGDTGMKGHRLCIALVVGVSLSASSIFGEAPQRPEPHDWYAGDAHVHRGIGCGREHEKEMLTGEQLLEMMKPNNLAVISVLSDIGNGELKYVEKDLPLMTGKDNPVSTPDRILHWDAEWHYDPDGVTFAKKVIGGHLILLGLNQGGQPFAHYTFPILDWAKTHGGIGGFAHMQYLPFAFYPPPDGLLHSLDCCSPLEFPVETALGTSSFLMEDVHGSDAALQAYYKILNTGFRPGLVASTDYSCNYLEPLGTLLTYVQVPEGKLTYNKWIEGIAKGRTVVSRTGHNEFLNLTINGASTPGDELNLPAKAPVKVRIEWTSLKDNIGRIELVQNGAVVASQTAQAGPGKPAVFETTVDVPKSGWLAARRMDWQNGHQTQTGAVFILVGGQPIRASASDAEFFVKWIDNLIQQTSPGGAWSSYLGDERDAAQARYREARAIFVQREQDAKTQAETNQ
jgi:hypothetical protein